MNKRGVLVLSIVLLVFVILALVYLYGRPASFVLPDKPGTSEPPPPTIHISEGGNLTDKIQQNGYIFTLMEDIFNYTISLEKNDVVLDGGGHILQGTVGETGWMFGILLADGSNNITIRNFRITGFSEAISGSRCSNITIEGNKIMGNPGEGVTFSASSGIHISENEIVANDKGGLSLGGGSNNTIADNFVTDNREYGICFSHLSKIILRNNTLRNNTANIVGISGNEDIDDSNTVEGQPVYYWVNATNKVVPSDAGLVVLWNCENITVKNLVLAPENEVALMLVSTTDSMITENSLTGNNFGIAASDSSSNTISENYLANNRNSGIKLENCDDFQILRNNIADNSGHGIFTNSSHRNTIAGNTLTSNSWFGVEVKNGEDNVISQNDFFRNGAGIQNGGGGVDIIGGARNLIVGNLFKENDGFGARISGSTNSSFYRNDFINNVNYDNGQMISGIQVSNPWLAGPEFNTWDDGVRGNYWSDYWTRYENVTEIDTSGIGDTPFFINSGNIDRYPVVKPFRATEAPRRENSTSPTT